MLKPSILSQYIVDRFVPVSSEFNFLAWLATDSANWLSSVSWDC